MSRSALIDRVAYAIYCNFIRNDPRSAERWEKMKEVPKQRWRDDAAAAIAVVEQAVGRLPMGPS